MDLEAIDQGRFQLPHRGTGSAASDERRQGYPFRSLAWPRGRTLPVKRRERELARRVCSEAGW